MRHDPHTSLLLTRQRLLEDQRRADQQRLASRVDGPSRWGRVVSALAERSRAPSVAVRPRPATEVTGVANTVHLGQSC